MNNPIRDDDNVNIWKTTRKLMLSERLGIMLLKTSFCFKDCRVTLWKGEVMWVLIQNGINFICAWFCRQKIEYNFNYFTHIDITTKAMWNGPLKLLVPHNQWNFIFFSFLVILVTYLKIYYITPVKWNSASAGKSYWKISWIIFTIAPLLSPE